MEINDILDGDLLGKLDLSMPTFSSRDLQPLLLIQIVRELRRLNESMADLDKQLAKLGMKL